MIISMIIFSSLPTHDFSSHLFTCCHIHSSLNLLVDELYIYQRNEYENITFQKNIMVMCVANIKQQCTQ
jgi:hypothetical protein